MALFCLLFGGIFRGVWNILYLSFFFFLGKFKFLIRLCFIKSEFSTSTYYFLLISFPYLPVLSEL